MQKARKDDVEDDERIVLVGFEDEEVVQLEETLDGWLAKEEEKKRVAIHLVKGEEGLMRNVYGEKKTDESNFKIQPNMRVVLLHGEYVKYLLDLGLKFEMLERGFAPSIFGAFTKKNEMKSIAFCIRQVVSAHERFWKLRGTENDLIEDKGEIDDEDTVTTTSWPDGEDGISIFNPSIVRCATSVALEEQM